MASLLDNLAPPSAASSALEALPPPPRQSSGPTISADTPPSSIGGKLSRWAQNVSDDIKYGTDVTGVGSILKKLGAHGVYDGAPHAVGDFMASLPLGLLRATRGAGELSDGQVIQGGKDIVGGAGQATEMATPFVAPEAAAAGASKVIGAIDNAIPQASRAGQKFSEVMEAAKELPVDVRGPGDSALRYFELKKAGGSNIKVLNDFLNRVASPEAGPLTYKEARDFYSNATRISVDDSLKISPVMRRQLSEFTNSLGDAIQDTADQAGKLDQYTEAMKEYHAAMRLRAVGAGIKDLLTSKTAAAAAATGAGGAVGAYAVRELLK